MKNGKLTEINGKPCANLLKLIEEQEQKVVKHPSKENVCLQLADFIYVDLCGDLIK